MKKPTQKKIFVITGVSGAGKSQALKVFEDFGWFCVDNLPIALLDSFADFVQKSSAMTRVALGMDVREGRVLEALPPLLRRLKQQGLDINVLFIDATDAIVIHRFSETRHRHPLGGKIADAVKQERSILAPIKGTADKVIDTTRLTLGELKEKISETLGLTLTREMTLQVVSFGYKHGMPIDADIIMDVRFLPNPHYQRALRKKTGLDAPVQKYILAQPVARKFLNDWHKLIATLLPHYVREGKSYLTIAIGCTGGHHRSVFCTRWLAQRLRATGHPVQEFHRDITL
ncbi:MAG: RNase adapter RapZ [Elusimicrobia bacterium CG11_big_fil_rev_8_21_14_0_20_64_6]|nr:MAG: RNase adapter RapZ [Elusimicrobia bacterium CG11_big_fil_rev_8_21_14_0_20_64_6]